MRRRWTEQDKRRALELVSEFGPNREPIAAALGCTFQQLDNLIIRRIGPEYREAVKAYAARMRAQAEVAPHARRPHTDLVIGPPAPFEVPLTPAAVNARPDDTFTALLYGDEQAPFHDEDCVALVRAIGRETQPNVVVNMGDATDCYAISKFSKDYRRRFELQQDVDATRRNLYRVAHDTPTSRHLLLEGNHEDRMRRTLDSAPEEVKQILRLDTVAPNLRWPHVLKLDESGFEWVDTEHQPSADALPKALVEHGSVLSTYSAYTARRELEKHGRTGFSGHTHRLGLYARRDYNGQSRWTETGCCCQYAQPYGNRFNWQQGCVFAEWTSDHRLMQGYEIFFRDGRAIWRGMEFVAPVEMSAAA